MCLIAIKDEGVPLTKEFYKSLARSFLLRNYHGSGFAILKKDSKTIYMRKSIYNLRELIHSIKAQNIGLDDILVVHLRRSSGSHQSSMNTQPMVMSNKFIQLNKLEGFTKEDVLFHNGYITSYDKFLPYYSDTYAFVHHFANSKNFTKFAKSLQNKNKLGELTKFVFHSNKVVVLSPESKLLIINEGSFIKKNGYLYSNDSFDIPKKIIEFDDSDYDRFANERRFFRRGFSD
jgi:predicted glutamine amidotransferase